MMLDGLQPEILLPAFVAGLLVLVTHVPLGREVLRRGIIFMDLAIAQFAGLGLIAIHATGLDVPPGLAQLAAAAAALLGAVLLQRVERNAPHRQEALIGVAYVVAACAALLLLAQDPQGGEHLQTLLVGQILWSSWASLWPLAVVSGMVLLLWHGLRATRHASLAFYLLFAVMVTTSVQVVGGYLVFASLIIPALVAGQTTRRAYLVGALAYAFGLLASALYDLPAGAAIVLAMALCAWGQSVGMRWWRTDTENA